MFTFSLMDRITINYKVFVMMAWFFLIARGYATYLVSLSRLGITVLRMTHFLVSYLVGRSFFISFVTIVTRVITSND